ncbi:MAG TPA: response regulator [Pyrinomonadaceae bacterium]|jgi:CheY-like chemotaxis protein
MKSILLVEDFEDSRYMMRMLLEMSGYRVLEAADGRRAVELAREECPDLVLMDLSLPVLDGLSATREIRRMDNISNLPVIALTAHGTEEFQDAALTAGCDEFVTKPIDFDLLESVIREQLGKRGTRACGSVSPFMENTNRVSHLSHKPTRSPEY